MIIIVFGLPGSGKSYFAKELAKKIGARLISSDVIRKQLVSTPTYSQEEKVLIYKEMLEIMYEYLHKREHLILDGTFYSAFIRNNFIEQARVLGKKIKFIEMKADEEVIKKRLNKKREFSDADFEIYKMIRDRFEKFNKKHLILQSTDDNIDDLIEEAISYLNVNPSIIRN